MVGLLLWLLLPKCESKEHRPTPNKDTQSIVLTHTHIFNPKLIHSIFFVNERYLCLIHSFCDVEVQVSYVMWPNHNISVMYKCNTNLTMQHNLLTHKEAFNTHDTVLKKKIESTNIFKSNQLKI